MITVRFAPSPTGNLHIGGARTALFNWLYAKNQSGRFILRIEDTDLERSKKEYVEEILDSMRWLGMDWDELFYQSQRFDLYRQCADTLLKEDKAYREGEAVILKVPQQEVVVHDLIRGEIRFDTATIKDQVLLKSDGSPTYSFACVVDDAKMGITHVIRGDDHISNTPKQILIALAFGWKPPKYAHLPLIMGEDGARLSKRTGAVAVSEYRAMGFIPEGIVNYLLLLGWSPGNEEIIDPEKAVKKFSIKKINKTAAVFSMDKLKWVNAQHIKTKKPAALVELLVPLLKKKGYIGDDFDRKHLQTVVQLFQRRMDTLQDFLDRAGFIFAEDIEIPAEARAQHLTPDKRRVFERLARRLECLDDYTAQTVEETFRTLVGEEGLAPADLVHPVRVALTGQTVGPGLFETMEALGKDKTVRRLDAAYSGSEI